MRLGTRPPDPRQAEVEDLDGAGRGQEQVRRLDVAVDDAVGVGRGQAASDLARVVERFASPQRTVPHHPGERRAHEQLRHQVRAPVLASDVEDREHVWVRERGSGAGLPLEALQTVRVRGERFRQDLERHLAVQLGVTGAVDLAHPARAERRDNFVTPELLPRREHERSSRAGSLWLDCSSSRDAHPDGL